MEMKMKLLMHAKSEAERTLDTAITKFPGDESFFKYVNELEVIFKTNRWVPKVEKDEPGNSKIPSTPGKERGKKEYVEDMEVKMKLLMHAKSEAERTLETAITKFPGDESFFKFINGIETLFKTKRSGPKVEKDVPCSINITTPTGEKVKDNVDSATEEWDQCWDSSKFVSDAIESADKALIKSELRQYQVKSTSNQVNEKGKAIIGQDATMGFNDKGKIVVIGTDTSDVFINKGKGGVRQDTSKESKATTEMVTIENHIGNRVRETRRMLKLGDHLRSPYMERCVDLQVNLEDKRAHEWIISSSGKKSDYVFWGQDDTRLYRTDMESLARKTDVRRSVIDAWSSLLNYDERYRNRDSPRRYFFPANMIEKLSTNNLIKDYNTFTRNLSAASKNNMEVVRMKNIDLVFFPMLRSGHYFVVVFNLKNPSVVILDNMVSAQSDDETMLKSYGYATDVLHVLMVKHLTTMEHTHAKAMRDTCQERLHMDWQTHHNYNSSGIFAMRHMETYKGSNKAWRTGFHTAKVETQLLDLRMKYVSKLLRSECNKKIGFIKEQLSKFLSDDDKIRAKD
ncbi:hypothetical protein OSB04_019898 [Centaurea solstitialis]|uniref:Ubiquitin-like protease family profile domain-containing protein n=1 Tax=Centaurea solstitialis TaxID=347529 RepID=A0AA38WCS7_9ASTR|nr:hypothetical protein OSB04_019898 [Centaurea solstitialis]